MQYYGDSFSTRGLRTELKYTEKIPVTYYDCATYSKKVLESIVLCEHKLNIYVNEKFLGYIICTPQNLTELVIGHLYTGNVISSIKDIREIAFNDDNSECRVDLNIDCNIENKQERITLSENYQISVIPEKIRQETKQKTEISIEKIMRLAEVFRKDTPLHEVTHGTHSCFLACESDTLFVCEDLGRHNALDKAIGMGILYHIDFSKSIVYTSGRVPMDMMNKIICAGIPVIASNTVPTKQAIDLAKEKNIVLIGRTKVNGFVLYS